MAAKEVVQNKQICGEGQPLDSIHIIVSGSVKAQFHGNEIILKKGDIVGLCDLAFDSHFFTYTTIENSSFVSFPFKDKSSILNIAKTNPEVGKMMYTSIINQAFLILSNYTKSKDEGKALYEKINFLYDQYSDICSKNNVISRSLPQFEAFEAPSIEDDVDEWLPPFYAAIKDFPPDLKHSLSSRPGYLYGFLIRASIDIHSVFSAFGQLEDYVTENTGLIFADSGLDLFDLYTSLYSRLRPGTPDADKVTGTIDEMIEYLKGKPFVHESELNTRISEYKAKLQGQPQKASEEKSAPAMSNAELTGSLDVILEYSGVSDELAGNFKKLIGQYKKLTDKASSDDAPRKLRLELTKAFYQIYTEAFQVSVRDVALPTILKMFFNFGYVDEELAGIENANYLYSIADDFIGDVNKGVYTIYDWLRAVYSMEKDPSRNEFDTDYLAYLHEQKVQGKITADQERLMADDPGQRVMFEIENMFPMVNKVTYGRLTSFCPVFSEHDVIKPLQSCLVDTEMLMESIKKVEEIDYGAYYREIIYTNDACGVSKELINVRITPDFILMPNIGTRGVMWQEIEGRKRTTPSRFMVSIFHLEDLPTTLTRLTGEYRWEMCKRVQGARWNDVSDRSLTSEYFDYVQFYKKNNELSADAKEKIKASLQKAKNSFKEMFVRDYITWILFEGQGSPRLNKLVRAIMATYCPFPKALRGKVAANPLFKDILERYEIKTSQKLHHFDNVIQKIKACGQSVPDELLDQRNFIDGNV